ncbi:MAG: DegT/DnrJ/EryC1/StrS family aminotransferase [Acidobacteriaceae bacterium]
MQALPDSREIPLLDLSAQYISIKHQIDEAMRRVISTSDFILGAELELFEAEFAAFCGVKHCIGVDSGLSAMDLVLRAWGIGPGDEVITAANTFIATALAVSRSGATPVLVDVDPQSRNIDPDAVRAAITPRTRAVIPVHLYGLPAEMDAINEIAAQYGLAVLEDACQAHGARYKGKRAGSLGHAAAFSFYPGRNLGAFGDGGAILTDDGALADQLRSMRNYGRKSKYVHLSKGFNCRLDTLQAAILRVKLRYLDGWNALRDRHARTYHDLLFGSSIGLPSSHEGLESAWYLYVVRSPFRDRMKTHLKAHGIEAGLHYPTPIHLQPAYADAGYRRGDFPVTERLSDEILSLPMYAELDRDSLERVVDAVLSSPGVKHAPLSILAARPVAAGALRAI